MSNVPSFAGALAQWLTLHSLGRRPGAQKFNREIVGIVSKNWPGWLNAQCDTITSAEVTKFAERVSRYCDSRWNACVSALQSITPLAKALKRRRLRCKERAMLTAEQFNRLLEELDKRPQSYAGLVIRFLAHTGMRIGEARKLRWTDIEADRIRVPGTITKNGKGRVIPFVNGIEQTLAQLRSVTELAVLPQAECKRSLQTACRVAGVPRLSHHDFRHLFATRCIQSGVDIPTVARWLGHSDGGALLSRTYYHLVDEHSRKMAARVTITA